MSVLCCTIPDFAINLVCRHQPALVGKPLVLLDAEERVCALSPTARQAGVRMSMPPRQAQTHCPDLCLLPLELTTCQAEQAALLGLLADWELPVEELTWGAAYLDLHSLATTAAKVQPLASQLGRQVRQQLGAALQPAIGWDSGKFTARAAALRVPAGRMRLVDRADETSFLAPLPITLLPLPYQSLQQLHWLGVRTLAQFASLPPVAVQQRLGLAGRQAQQWARGQDTRPVRPTVQAAPEPISVDLDPPTANLSLVVASILAALHAPLQELSNRLEGCRRLRIELHFLEGSQRTLDLAWVEPLSQPASLQPILTHHLRSFDWPGELIRLRLTLLSVTELSLQQLSLFPTEPPANGLAKLARQLTTRYGPRFLQAAQTDPTHPIAARRFQFQPLP